MAIDLTRLFTQIGRVGKLAYVADTHGSAVPAATDDLFDQYDETDRWLLPAAETEAPLTPGLAGSDMPVYADLATRTLLKAVADDNQPQAADLRSAMAEVIRQMVLGAVTVKRSTCAATPTALAGMQGTGTIVLTTTRGDGTGLELCVPETARVACLTDSYSQTATAGSEGFRFYGQLPNINGVWAYDWPGGSGVQTDFSAVDANTGPAANANLLSNSGFETFGTANIPDGWLVDVGTPGTNVFQELTTVYAGTSSLKFVGGAVNLQVSQTFISAGGVMPQPRYAYAVNLWVRVHTVPAAGVLTIDLYDTTAAAVVADAAGTNNTKAVTLSGLTNDTWTNVTAVFRLPKVVPPGLQVRLRLSTALSAGSNLFIDHLAMAPVIVPYPMGPGVAVFGGSVPFAVGDSWSAVIANDNGGASLNASFQPLFDRIFGMKAMGLQLNSASSPSLSNALITA